MKEKDIFDVQALSKEAFAESLGLADVPVGADWEGDEDLEKNKMKKKKNQSALQRLKEKIRAKKQGRDKDAAKREEDEEEERELSQRDGARKKLGKWERRQRRIAAAGKAAEGVDAPAKEEDDFLQPVANPQELPPANPLPSGNKKLKLRKDGSALQASGQHVFFSKDGSKKTSELAQLAEELRSEQFDPKGGNRASFLEQVARDLATRDSSDAAVSRARIHEKHQKKRRKERTQRGAKLEDGEDPPSRSPSPPKKRAREAPEETAPMKVSKPVSKPVDFGDDLGDLEKQALSKLGGLFS